MTIRLPPRTPEAPEEDAATSMPRADDHGPMNCWTAHLPATDHIRFFRTTNWVTTALGPLESWCPTLRLFAGFVLADSRAACLWWGPDLTAIYNEAYAPLAAQAHPRLMGSTFMAGYPDLYPHIMSYFDQCRRTGAGVNYSSAVPLLTERSGFREETYFSGSFTPVGPPGQPLGFFNSTFEVTTQMIAERRTSLLNRLAAVAKFSAVDAAYAHILATLETNPNDIPLAMLYKFESDVGPSPLQLHGHFGLPESHTLLVESAYIDSEAGLIPDMRRAGSEAIMIPYDARFDGVQWKGWGAPPKQIAILPITSGARLFGYLVAGTNPYRPHDDLCEQFGRDLNRMVSSIIASAVDHASVKRRQEQLEADLAFSDLKLRHLINHASVGMCHVSLDGQMLWANEHYYHLGASSAEEQAPRYAFFDVYHEDDRQKAMEVFEKLVAGADHVTAELRLKRKFQTPSGESEPAHLQILAFPYRDPDTCQVKSIMACTTDISRLKWAQAFEARLAAEAREAKRQQEAFIDVVSHEMRNPLSAIVHCADAITSTLDEAELSSMPPDCLDALKDNVHSAKIILQCAHHQKRIIDDILTLSKLDSMLLSITPVAVKVPKLVESIVSIFEAEMKSHGIHYNVEPDASLSDLDIGILYLDPSRVTQVFINLITNAIKFVKPSKKPLISIRYGACLARPRAFFPDRMFWATESKQDDDVTNSPEWGMGQEVYLAFTVQDSGIGLEDKEIHKIFERFRQANVKTHVQYGGSGLGLFISKELTEKQGGEIGVSSLPGQGSTFGFYVKTRRVEHRPKLDTGMRRNSRQQGPASPQLRVLLVEDNLINQQVLSKQLRKAGCTVAVANHGLEALKVLDEELFDVCLMDLEMPVMDGLAATSTIRQKELAGEGLLGQAMASGPRAGARLPIIVVTANVRKEQINTAIAAGADRVMQKPFKSEDLVFMMRSLLPDTAPTNIEPPTPELAIRSNGLIP